jgi:ubiquinone/menaquinone biosynthesis C-methylase UbiE
VNPSDFASRAATYDELRPVEPGRFDWLAEAGELRGRRVLDIGCGTGQVTIALAESFGAKAWGIDPSPEMLDVARHKAQGIEFSLGTAERLPFGDDSFDAAFMALVIHHVDRPLAFREIERVLVPGGRLAISTPDPRGFDRHWMSVFFPSFADIERSRFPSGATLTTELETAGFSSVRTQPRTIDRRVSRELVLKRLHGRWASTFELLPADEIEAGIERAERELGDPVEYTLEWLVVVAQA